jgi:hypothetical protein
MPAIPGSDETTDARRSATPPPRDPRISTRPGGDAASQQPPPGRTDDMQPEPDHGEESYEGTGRLRGRRALITGGDSGIGRAVAIAFAREGADVALTFLPAERDDAEAVEAAIVDAGARACLLEGDLRDESFATGCVEDARDALGGLDILVLNAAQQTDRDGVTGLTRAEMAPVLETNLLAIVDTVRAAEPHLEAGASVIVTSSIQAAQPSAGLLDYAMTKAAQIAFVTALAEHWGERGIRVNAVAPGPIWTPLIPSTGWPDERVEDFGSDTPLGRAGQPAELAGAFVYLASDEARYVSGAVLPVTGGRAL